MIVILLESIKGITVKFFSSDLCLTFSVEHNFERKERNSTSNEAFFFSPLDFDPFFQNMELFCYDL